MTGGRGRRVSPGVLWLVACALLLGVAGCGRKAPPVVPRIPAPVGVSDLAATVDNGRVTLEWGVPTAAGVSPPEGFRIYRADLGPADCADCPLLFVKIGELRLDPQQRPTPGKPWRLSWRDTPASGQRYVYKVSAYGRGRETVDSNLVGIQR